MKVQSLSLWAPLTHKTSPCFRFTEGKNSAISCAFEISVRLILFFPAGPLILVLENDSPLSSPYRHFNNSLTCHSLSFSSASSFLPPSWLPPSLACNLNILPFSSARTKLLRPHSLCPASSRFHPTCLFLVFWRAREAQTEGERDNEC